MSETASAWNTAPSAIVTATVRSVRGVRIDVESPRFGAVSGRLAVAGAYRPRAGDSVLVAMADDGAYVIGVLRALRESGPQVLEAADGSSAALEQDEDGSVWRLRDQAGRLVFEHRPGRSVVHVHEDLELSAGGDVAIAAGGVVRLEGEQALVSAKGKVALRSERSELSLDGDRARMESELLETRVGRADVHAKEVDLVAGTLRTVAKRVRERADVVERKAGRVVERAREVYREVEELSQTKAGRLRLVASTAMTLLGQQTLVKAREDVKIKGEKIYLG